MYCLRNLTHSLTHSLTLSVCVCVYVICLVQQHISLLVCLMLLGFTSKTRALCECLWPYRFARPWQFCRNELRFTQACILFGHIFQNAQTDICRLLVDHAHYTSSLQRRPPK